MPLLPTSARLLALAALTTGGVLLAQAGSAAAAPDPTTTGTITTSAPTGSTTTGSTTSGSTTTGSTTTGSSSAAGSSTGATSAGSSASTPHPATTALSGPPCTTNATATYPVICLPDGSGEDQQGVLTQGDTVEFDSQIVNNGPAVKDATVLITLPQGLRFESDEDNPVYRVDDWYVDNGDGGTETDLTCTPVVATVRTAAAPAASTSYSCDLGALAQGANILVGIDLELAPGAPVGSVQHFSVALQPVAPDDYPSTEVEASILVAAPAHLVVSLDPSAVRAVVGSTTSLTGTVRNAGPGVAPQTVALAISANRKNETDSHFTIVGGTDITTIFGSGPDSGSLGVVTGSSSATRTLLYRRAAAHAPAARSTDPTARVWPIGTLAPGASTKVTVQVKAVSVGTDTLLFGALSEVSDPTCNDGGASGGSSASASAPVTDSASPVVRAAAATTPPGDCQNIVTVDLTAVAAAPASSATPLANSGTHDLDVQLGVAVWAIAAGALLLWVGRRRIAHVAGRHRH